MQTSKFIVMKQSPQNISCRKNNKIHKCKHFIPRGSSDRDNKGNPRGKQYEIINGMGANFFSYVFYKIIHVLEN